MQILKRLLKGNCQPFKGIKKTDKECCLSDIIKQGETSNKVIRSGLPIIKRFPGFVYGPLRNIGPYRFEIGQSICTVRIELINESAEILNFNYVGLWIRNSKGLIEKYAGSYTCEMSSVSKVLPDPNGPMVGDESNTVSVHSTREIKPYWQLKLPENTHIEFVEFYNRKDMWGVRSRGMLLSVFDAEGNRIARFCRVMAKEVNHVFSQHGLTILENILLYLRSKGMKHQADSIEKLLVQHLTDAEEDSEQTQQLLKMLCIADESISIDTPDLAGTESEALTFTLPQGATNFRVIAFAPKGTRPFELNVSVNDASSIIQASTSTIINDEILRLRAQNWLLQSPHIFETELEPQVKTNIKIWHGGFYSAAAFVQRVVQYSEDGKIWHTLNTTLDNMTARLGLLEIQEWLLGKAWNKSFCFRLGQFMATYRSSHARAVKGLFKNQRELMPDFFAGIDAGAGSAKYIPRVTYARHGLVVPLAEIDSEFLASRMKRFCDFVKDTFGLDAFLCYGTLLGIYRDGDFLPHDDDLDLAVVVDLPNNISYRAASERWQQVFADAGVKCRLPTPTSLNMHCYFEDFDMDLFFIYRIPNKPHKVWTHMEGYQPREVKAALFEPYSTVDFKGFKFNVPGEIEGFLKDRYGTGWVTPDPTFEL